MFGTVIDSIKVIRSGKVRRAKLYYLRDRTGKSARIAKKIRKKIGIDIDVKPESVSEENLAPVTEVNISENTKEVSPVVEPKIEETLKNEVKKDVSKAETSSEKKHENLQEKK